MIQSSIYNGIITTPNLWKHALVEDIDQLELSADSIQNELISTKIRLGMFAEQCVFQALESDSKFQLLAKNIQIIENNITLGELDCILESESKIIHLEIAYKFYLFDPNMSKNELSCWIGPNKKDSLLEKIEKLKKKQLPLLFHSKTAESLSKLGVSADSIQQKVCFKAQLFTPFSSNKVDYKTINTDCIYGVYYTKHELLEINQRTFYIPDKLEWIVTPHQSVKWINYDTFIEQIDTYLRNQKSPLFWSKDKKGNLSKGFAVWW